MTPRTPRADSARNREALLDAGMRALRRDVDAPLDAIAAEAGLTRRAVYGHFTGRDELVDAVIERGAARIADAVGPARDEDPLVAIARLGSCLWDAIAEVRAVARMAVRSRHAATVGRALAPVRDRLRESLSRAAEAGAVRTDVDVDVLASLVERAALDVLEVEPESGRLLAMTHPLCAAGVGAAAAARAAAMADADLADGAR
ncbi:TetR/AcrR family transcriptional regulator [Demequina phytophila]|uniref:TetR/AcrR family transcriptional regulator n=1 Tax=Demequina phytophila TaxID=1638981 RepID=UPI000785DE69|nr:TetR/AcrR family transcriptional regulator [Demequina phytophila]